MRFDSWPQEALAGAKPAVFWSDRDDAPPTAPTLGGKLTSDLTIVGAGLTGLWAAIQALEDQPGLRVVVLEAERCGFGASSRNGGFCDSSLTHGLENGVMHWPDEIETLLRMGRQNLDDIESSIERYGISADFRRAAEVGVATEPWHLESLEESAATHESLGLDVTLLDAEAMRIRIASPTYLGGLVHHTGTSLVDPARLCWGLRAAAEGLGAQVYEESPAKAVERDGSSLNVVTSAGEVASERVLVGTNAYRAPVRGPRRYIVPVYEHVLMTEPLSADQLSSIRWDENDGVGDVSNQLHYYRRSEDDRILWGGYDANYHFNNGTGPEFDQSDRTHSTLAEHFFQTFPQLRGLRFTHRWGGPIGTTTRFTAGWGLTHGGRLSWVGGYTGLGVGASRFGARVALDLVFGQETERTELAMVRERAFPFPPEPLRWVGVRATRRAMQRADENMGRRGLWLRLLDRLGIGFDS
ncbi:MAG TPA: FAD-binding oxidoreductase [Acidimicrobiia bacterium]